MNARELLTTILRGAAIYAPDDESLCSFYNAITNAIAEAQVAHRNDDENAACRDMLDLLANCIRLKFDASGVDDTDEEETARVIRALCDVD